MKAHVVTYTEGEGGGFKVESHPDKDKFASDVKDGKVTIPAGALVFIGAQLKAETKVVLTGEAAVQRGKRGPNKNKGEKSKTAEKADTKVETKTEVKAEKTKKTEKPAAGPSAPPQLAVAPTPESASAPSDEPELIGVGSSNAADDPFSE